MKESQAINRGEELPLYPITAGMPSSASQHVHAVQFNDLNAVENLIKTENTACIILEPILQKLV